MKTRADFETALAVVGGVVRRWDPYGLLGAGAPADEFDSEIRALARLVPAMTSAASAALAISQVFSDAFEPVRFAPANCVEQGRELHRRLVSAKLITGSDES